MALLSHSQEDNILTMMSRLKQRALEAQETAMAPAKVSKGVFNKPKEEGSAATGDGMVLNVVNRLRQKADAAIAEQKPIELGSYNVNALSMPASQNRPEGRSSSVAESLVTKVSDKVFGTGDTEKPAVDADAIDSAVTEAVTSSDSGLMSRPKARPTKDLTDDAIGLSTAAVSEYNFMRPKSKFRTALKDKEAESYQTLFGDAQENNTPFKGVDITSMRMADVLDLTKSNGEFHKYNKKEFSKNTTAVGKYQFIGSTLRDLKKRGVFTKLGIDDDTLFDEKTQDKLSAYQAIHRLKDRGDGTISGARKEMRNEWEGFKKISDTELDGIINEISGEIGVFIGGTKLASRTSLRPQKRPDTQVAGN